MNDHIRSLRDDVRRLLDAKIASESDFIYVSIAGERLRRSSYGRSPDVDEVLAEYDRFLSSRPTTIPESLDLDIETVLRGLDEYAGTPIARRTAFDGEELLHGIDELLCTLAASWRCGARLQAEVEKIGLSVVESVSRIAPDLADLSDFADARQISLGPDPQLPMLFAFWECVARVSPARIAVEAALREHSRREDVLRGFERHVACVEACTFADLDEALALAEERNRISSLLLRSVEQFRVAHSGAGADFLLAVALQINGELERALIAANRATLAAVAEDDACLLFRCAARTANILEELDRDDESLLLRRRARAWMAAPAIERAESTGDARLIAQIALLNGTLAASFEDWDVATRAAERVRQLPVGSTTPRLECSARCLLGWARYNKKEAIDVILGVARDCARDAKRLQLLETLALSQFLEGVVLLGNGRQEEALPVLSRAYLVAGRLNDSGRTDHFRSVALFARSFVEERAIAKRVGDLNEAERLAVLGEQWTLAGACAFRRALLRRDAAHDAALVDVVQAGKLATLGSDEAGVFHSKVLQVYWLAEDDLVAEATHVLAEVRALAEKMSPVDQGFAAHAEFVCAVENEDFASAVGHVQKAHRLAGNSIDYRSDIVFALAAAERTPEAVAAAREFALDVEAIVGCVASLLVKDRPAAANALADLAVEMGRAAGAPWNERALFMRSLVHAAANDKSATREDLRRVIATGIDSALVETAKILQVVLRIDSGELEPNDSTVYETATSRVPLLNSAFDVVRDLLLLDALNAHGKHDAALAHSVALRASTKPLWSDAIAALAWSDMHALYRKGNADVVRMRAILQASSEVIADDPLSSGGRALFAFATSLILACEKEFGSAIATLDEVLEGLPDGQAKRWGSNFRASLAAKTKPADDLFASVVLRLLEFPVHHAEEALWCGGRAGAGSAVERALRSPKVQPTLLS